MLNWYALLIPIWRIGIIKIPQWIPLHPWEIIPIPIYALMDWYRYWYWYRVMSQYIPILLILILNGSVSVLVSVSYQYRVICPDTNTRVKTYTNIDNYKSYWNQYRYCILVSVSVSLQHFRLKFCYHYDRPSILSWGGNLPLES